jgi:hypothetical protein
MRAIDRCPHCAYVPDVPGCFVDDGKWGSVLCGECGARGPDVPVEDGWQEAAIKQYNRRSSRGMPKTCKQCGKSLRMGKIKGRPTYYCGRECYHNSRKGSKKPLRICQRLGCNNNLQRGNERFCSRLCYDRTVIRGRISLVCEGIAA